MKKVLGVVTLLVILAFAVSLFAQDPPVRLQMGQRQRGLRVNLTDKTQANKDSLALYLALTEQQKPKVFALIDSIAKIYDPYTKELTALAEKYGLGQMLVSQRNVGGGGGIGNISQEQIQQGIAEMNALGSKYEPKQPKLDAFVASIEKLLTVEQKTKFAAIRKPTFTMFQRGG